jgi:hypothetical protein
MKPQTCHYTRLNEVVDDDAQPHREHAQSTAEFIVSEKNDDDCRQSNYRTSDAQDQHALGPSTSRKRKRKRHVNDRSSKSVSC